MEEHPLLAAFAKLIADFIGTDQNDEAPLNTLLNRCALALLQGQEPSSMRDSFEFERIQYFTTQYLKAEERDMLHVRLRKVEQDRALRPEQFRVFLREMPNRVSWIRSSIPDWAVSAELVESLNPVTNRDGRRFWLDIYKIPATIRELRFHGANKPNIILGFDTPLVITPRRVNLPFRIVSKIEMGEGTVWLQATMLVADANEQLYCGVRVASATVTFPGFISDDARQARGEFLMVHDPNIKASITLKLAAAIEQNGVGAYGADARETHIRLPETMTIQYNQTASTLALVADNASCNLYGNPKIFTWTGQPAGNGAFFKAASIPMALDSEDLVINQRQSPVLGLAGATQLFDGAWVLPMTKLGVPLQAEGGGMLFVKTKKGLLATSSGLLDVNRVAAAQLRFDESYLIAASNVLHVISPKTTTENAIQRLRLWQGSEARWNDLTMSFKNLFPVIYQCDAAGLETIATLADCAGNLDRPVSADGLPLALKAKSSLVLRAFAELRDFVVIYDENILRDNAADAIQVGGAPMFPSQAIALNNALMTVSPLNAFLLSGQLPPMAETFLDACLNYAFGLLGYLPTLPDPYAANTGIFQWMGQRQGGNNGMVVLGEWQRLLVATLRWKGGEVPAVHFIFGDMERAANNLPVHLNPLLNLNLADNQENLTREARVRITAARIQKRMRREVEMRGDNYKLHLNVNDRFQHRHFFSLLDVSTAADWMGVDLGFIDEAFFFERSFDVRTDQNPLSADGMDVVASGHFVRLFTVPQISWEPVINTTPPFNINNDPPAGVLTFQDDGPPTLIGNTGREAVPIAPLPLAFYIGEKYRTDNNFKAWSFFTLPFGMLGIARYDQKGMNIGNPPGATIEVLQHQFEGGAKTALQISTIGYKHPQGNRNFEGVTEQLFNLKGPQGDPLDRSILSKTVTDIFNKEFGAAGNGGQLRQRGVPVERYDFSGYGANIFSHWLNPEAEIGQTSQAKFDVWRGRTAHEVVQVRSIIYPWCVHVVRTITMFRNSAGLVYRIDSGWRAESHGVYGFKNRIVDINGEEVDVAAYSFHPGVVGGVFDVRNIVETSEITPYTTTWNKTQGFYVDPNDGLMKGVGAGKNLNIELVPVYFDADVQMEDVVSGAVNGRVPSRRMLGYLQISPQGIVISPEHFRELLLLQNGLGGAVDCLVNIGGSNQTMRMSRVEVQPSRDTTNQLVFVTVAKGMPILPKDGSWSVVHHQKATKEVLPISNNVVPLIRRGLLGQPQNNPLELANPADLFTLNLENRTTQFAFLQNTDTQKVLFRNPWFEKGKQALQSSRPDLADAYRLLDSKGIFPKLDNIPRLDLNDFNLNITEGGYKLLNKIQPDKLLEQVLPEGPVYFINEKDVKIYVEYAKKDIKGNKTGDGILNYDLDSAARKWTNKLNDITMVIDLLDMKRLFLIRGKFDTEKGKTPAFTGPELEFGEALQPVYDILQILLLLNGGDYAGALTKGLKVAMSNSPNNWEYKFQADKEIPVLRFPPPAADSPVAPLRLECYLKLGCYFNVGMPLPSGEGVPVPSAGGYVEFGAKLSVMCLSVAAATVYAVGTCTLRIGADTVRGPNLYMKLGFGVELMVGLPVIGNVSIYFAAGIEISIDKRLIVVGAFILFRGRAELIGGLVTIQIQIEASGKISRDLVTNRTDCIAQVTFSLDISIFLVINISFSKSFQENRQIA